jgi:hypothetical protein
MKNDKHDVFLVYRSVLIFQKNDFLIVTDQFLMNRRNQITSVLPVFTKTERFSSIFESMVGREGEERKNT